ncbi:MAG: AMP-binding protein [Micromonosporaceae bacterium]|nr:AMP-binding protein [Micromonosporaceae bacterium]
MDGDQRVPAEVEEVVLHAHPVQPQRFLPQRRQRSLQVGARRHEGPGQPALCEGRPDGPGWHATLAELEESGAPGPIQTPAEPEDVAEILFTSGTTGSPKGVACRHLHVTQPLTDSHGWPPEWWQACADGVYLHANAVSTAGGQLRLLEPLGPQRMTALAQPRFDPERFCRLAEEHRAAVVQLVPAMASSIVDSEAYRRHDLSSVRVVSLGCAPLPMALTPKLASAFPNAHLVNMYELSEARYAGTAFTPEDGGKDGSVGMPRGASQVRITDDSGGDLASGVVGEVRVRWAGLPAQHYFGDAAATARVFADGWTRTGDAGYLDPDGCLYIVDRLKDVIIKGGINISSVEVENALREHPAVADCAVFGVPDQTHGEDVAAALVLRRPISPRDMRGFLTARLAPHQIPKRFVHLAALPRNRSGKVVKHELRARLLAGAATHSR